MERTTALEQLSLLQKKLYAYPYGQRRPLSGR